MKELKHLELFAGIGGFRRGIDLFCADNGIKSTCIGFSEIDKYATVSYKANYDTANEVEMGDVEAFTETIEQIKTLPDFDLLTGGFPCQAFSMMGKQLGFEDLRGNLFYSIIRILEIKKPKYVLLENVRNLKNHDEKRTYKEIVRSLKEEAGYEVISDVFNTSDFGLPQHRRRIYIFAIREDLVDETIDISKFTRDNVFDDFSSSEHQSLNYYNNVLDGVLEKKVDKKYYLSERIKPTILANGSKNFRSKSEINQMIARPLTATMVKMHRACQDNYYSDLFLKSKNPIKYLEKEIPKEVEVTHSIRKLTPLEALRLQGFDATFLKKAQNATVSNHQMYKQAGNAVSVNVVYALIHYISHHIIKEF
jgi:DNA (cytosine-5)-methyltransferase 1